MSGKISKNITFEDQLLNDYKRITRKVIKNRTR
jgi:hypothetical protein